MENNKPQDDQIIHVDGLYQNWFLDYASYVILERAVPAALDGVKPVQRRILHALREMDDGRFHKVANVIGQTMQFHPHGDAAIGDALVNMGQKELLFDTQGNWGDYRTGDKAAAPRYIEVRLSKFALEVAFNHQTTEWQLSYDGRKNEPIHLPMKFPLLLAQGAEGIAVGLSTKIMPHNFIELCDGSIDILQGNPTQLLPDFPTAGTMDASDYQSGKRGGKIRVRAKIEAADKKTLMVKDIPFGVTTDKLIDSIVKANDKGKIKIKKVTDNTAKHVEINIELPSGVSPDVTIDALYAFTDCEVSISPNACVIIDEKPHFLTVDRILEICTENTKALLKRELEIKLGELENKWHFSSLEKIFIENRIYRDIEECETWEAVLEAIDTGLEPHKHLLMREVTQDDIIRLTEIKIKRISKFDSFKADELIKSIEDGIAEVKYHLKHLTQYTIDYYRMLKEKFGKGRERKTAIQSFDTIAIRQVAVANQKLYVNRKEGFMGYGLKKDEYVCDCSDIDNIIIFRKDGKMMVTPVEDKKFVGKDILHIDVWRKGDDRKIYHAIYFDGDRKVYYVKRFAVKAITRDREYDITKGAPGSKVIYFTVNPNSESEVITVYLSPGNRAKNKVYDFDFAELAIKGRQSMGNIISRYPIKRIAQKSVGASTLGGVDIWLDRTVGRLNKDERGDLLGNFDTEDQILVVFKDGNYELTNFELTNRYDIPKIHSIQKFDAEQPLNVVYFDGESGKHYVKRFVIETTVQGKPYPFITEHKNTELLICSLHPDPIIEFTYLKGKAKEPVQESVPISEIIDVKGWKAMGNRLSLSEIDGPIVCKEPKIEQPSPAADDDLADEAPTLFE